MFSLLGTWDGWSMGQYGLEFSSEGRWGGGKGSGLIWLLDVFIHICPFPPSGATKSCYSLSHWRRVIPQGGFFSCDGKAAFLCFFMSHPDWAAK